MNVQYIKEYIRDNDCIELILKELDCHSIKKHSHYWTAGNPTGDNKSAITIYNDLGVINYTRDLPTPSDIFTLVQFYKEINFFQALKWVCEIIKLDPYVEEDQDLPEAVKLGRMLTEMNNGKNKNEEDNTPIKPIDEKILSYYKTPCVNDMFLKDGISYNTQVEFEIGYDDNTNRIIIPVRDEIFTLCGIKGRLFKDHVEKDELKYVYLEPCPRNKILYGYYKTFPYIKQNNWVWVGEAEKFVLQLWSYGYQNAVATSGEKVSKCQIDKLSRLAVPICFAFDEDVSREKLQHIVDQFIDGIEIWTIIDKDNILDEKESPSDNIEKWKTLIKDVKRIQ